MAIDTKEVQPSSKKRRTSRTNSKRNSDPGDAPNLRAISGPPTHSACAADQAAKDVEEVELLRVFRLLPGDDKVFLIGLMMRCLERCREESKGRLQLVKGGKAS